MKQSTKTALYIGGGALAVFVVGRWLLRSTGTGLGGVGALPEPAVGITRASCIECVEKHLGAALVLIAECRDGYPHRMRAIGHLHEAEDESQAFPELHAAIRTARKAFQQQGAVPDFEGLERLAARV